MSLSKTISTTNARKTLLSQASFRDVGGVVTKDGAVVKHGQVYRSGLLRHLQASDHVALSNIGLKSLFDLRGPAEKATERHDWAGFAKVTQPLEQVETLAGTQPRIWAQRLQNPAYTPEMARASLLHTYQDMPAKLATAVGALAQSVMGEEQGAVLVHCTAGKDRTGFVCAMLLFALGADKDEVLQDYLRANEHVPDLLGVKERFAQDEQVIPHKNTLAVLKVLYSVEPAFLEMALNGIVQRWGSIENYLNEAIGLDESRRTHLQRKLLTSA